ncbi:hypothetical protein BBK82_39085 [Lentzea guizhouensis]|uniref:Uncharacterized protein n=1 Tax=Lentzea guizhouensis TaxID=1586287 RepID=A0A1B2HTU1_9PSEU|nr:hypothetical protein BBK82_39085 [Lentzea guizhouensis]
MASGRRARPEPVGLGHQVERPASDTAATTGTRASSRPATHVASCPPAECPTTCTRVRSSGAATPARKSTAASTSSNVPGHPPPSPIRRYSMLHTACPADTRSSASGTTARRSHRPVQ